MSIRLSRKTIRAAIALIDANNETLRESHTVPLAFKVWGREKIDQAAKAEYEKVRALLKTMRAAL